VRGILCAWRKQQVQIEGLISQRDESEGCLHMSRGSGRVRGFLLYVPDLLEGRMHVSTMESFLIYILLFSPDQFAEEGF